jgi:hypothetical protein
MAFIFLEDGDLESGIFERFLTERSEENPQVILETIEKKKIAIIKTKLKGRYDTDAIFDANGDDRNYYIIDLLIKLVLYDFVGRNAARKVPKDYKEDYDWAMKMLEKIKAGKETPDGLPAFINEDGSTGRIISGNSKNSDFYI